MSRRAAGIRICARLGVALAAAVAGHSSALARPDPSLGGELVPTARDERPAGDSLPEAGLESRHQGDHALITEPHATCLEVRIPGGRGADLRRFVREEIRKAFPAVRPFGSYLDVLMAGIEPLLRDAPESFFLPVQIVVPDYFFAGSLDLRMHVDAQRKTLRVYADTILVAEEKVALGDHWMDDEERETDFTTKGGTYFINRIVRDPWWYPPRWSDRREPVPPGPGNPLGSWMAELCRDSTRGGYGFAASRRSTSMRLHGTHVELDDRLFPTHGCVRIGYETQEEFCAALLRYCPHDSARVTSRGEIIPLARPIRVDIVQ